MSTNSPLSINLSLPLSHALWKVYIRIDQSKVPHTRWSSFLNTNENFRPRFYNFEDTSKICEQPTCNKDSCGTTHVFCHEHDNNCDFPGCKEPRGQLCKWCNFHCIKHDKDVFNVKRGFDRHVISLLPYDCRTRNSVVMEAKVCNTFPMRLMVIINDACNAKPLNGQLMVSQCMLWATSCWWRSSH